MIISRTMILDVDNPQKAMHEEKEYIQLFSYT